MHCVIHILNVIKLWSFNWRFFFFNIYTNCFDRFWQVVLFFHTNPFFPSEILLPLFSIYFHTQNEGSRITKMCIWSAQFMQIGGGQWELTIQPTKVKHLIIQLWVCVLYINLLKYIWLVGWCHNSLNQTTACLFGFCVSFFPPFDALVCVCIDLRFSKWVSSSIGQSSIYCSYPLRDIYPLSVLILCWHKSRHNRVPPFLSCVA